MKPGWQASCSGDLGVQRLQGTLLTETDLMKKTVQRWCFFSSSFFCCPYLSEVRWRAIVKLKM